MNYIIGLIILLVGAVIFYKKRAKNALIDAVLGETRGKDELLKADQDSVKRAITELDAGIAKINADRKKERDARVNQTKDARANDWNK